MSTHIAQLSTAARAEADEILADFPNKKSALLMILRLVEREFGCIDDAGMELAAELCEVAPSHVLGMTSFYTHFKRPWHGKHRLMVCRTLMCDLGGAKDALREIEAVLNIKPGEITQDGLFSLEKVECLADCDRPPVIQVDSVHHVKISGEALRSMLEDLLKSEGRSAKDYASQVGRRMETGIPHIPVKQDVP